MLNSFSENIRDIILKRYPEWRTNMEVRTAPDGGEYLIFSIPRPTAEDANPGMTISTIDNEVTLNIHYGIHWHFKSYSTVWFADNLIEDEYGEEWVGLFKCIEAILNEKVVLGLPEEKGRSLSYELFAAEIAENIIRTGVVPADTISNASPDQLLLWSWTGQYDWNGHVSS